MALAIAYLNFFLFAIDQFVISLTSIIGADTYVLTYFSIAATTMLVFWLKFRNLNKNAIAYPMFWLLPLVMTVLVEFLTIFVMLEQLHIVSILLSFVFLAFCFVMLYLYDKLSRTHELELKSAIHSLERTYYFTQSQLMQESVKKVRSMRHDMNFHLATIKDFAVDNKTIADYIDSLIGNIDEGEVYSSTGNIAFDSIINFKLKNAAEDNIKLDLSLFIPPSINIEIADIVIILGNLLDNALTAVAKVEDKVIKLEIEFGKSNLFIKIDNTFDGNVKYAEGEEKHIVTLKSGEEHGHGLNNIRKSVEKYNGHINIAHDNNVFSVGVLLYVDVV